MMCCVWRGSVIRSIGLSALLLFPLAGVNRVSWMDALHDVSVAQDVEETDFPQPFFHAGDILLERLMYRNTG